MRKNQQDKSTNLLFETNTTQEGEPLSPQRIVCSVSELNLRARSLLLDNIKPLWVNGEVSNLARPPSGHIYFSLKDGTAQIRCAMFKSRASSINWAIENGQQVLAYAQLDIYTSRGDMQLIVEKMEMAGHGNLQQRFEELKKKLSEEGLFDEERKRAIPLYPQRIGVISSPQSAAMADIMKICSQHSDHTHTIIYPALVQGQEAPASIIEAIQHATTRKEIDVLIIARGGGSLEDLQAFNSERVVRAISACPIPVVSGIGHDIDFTLADFVADLRAPTPTAAAVQVYANTEQLIKSLNNMQQRFLRNIQHSLDMHHAQLNTQKKHLASLHPQAYIQNLMQRFDETATQLSHTMQNTLHQLQTRLSKLSHRCDYHSPLRTIEQYQHALEKKIALLHYSITQTSQDHKHRLNQINTRVQSINPLSILKRGYSIVTQDDGKIISSAKPLKKGDKLSIRFHQGSVKTSVDKTLD